MPDGSKVNDILDAILVKGQGLVREEFCKVRQIYDEYYTLILSHIRRMEETAGADSMILDSFEAIKLSWTLEDYYCRFKSALEEICRRRNDEGFLVRRSKHYIINHYNEAITLQKVAEHINVSAEHLSREFTKKNDCSFIQYLTNIRIEKAIGYLGKTNLNVAEIAEKVGYASADYLSRAFKKYSGLTLSEYRKKN
jgi:YesN/AraC family two-component response regulator